MKHKIYKVDEISLEEFNSLKFKTIHYVLEYRTSADIIDWTGELENEFFKIEYRYGLIKIGISEHEMFAGHTRYVSHVQFCEDMLQKVVELKKSNTENVLIEEYIRLYAYKVEPIQLDFPSVTKHFGWKFKRGVKTQYWY